MKWVTHKRMRLIPMTIVDVDVNFIIDELWKTSESIRDSKLKKRDVVSVNEKDNTCRLDPGGMLNMREPWVKFNIGGYDFETQLSKLDYVIHKVKKAKERFPNYKRIGLFRYNVICSVALAAELLEKLIELNKSDAAMHTQIDDAAIKSDIESKARVRFMEIPRENNE